MLQSGCAVPDNDGQSRSKSCDAAFGPRQALMQQQSARYPGTQDPGALPTFWLGNGDSAGTEVQKLRQMVLDWQAVSESAQMERDNAVRQVRYKCLSCPILVRSRPPCAVQMRVVALLVHSRPPHAV